MGNQAEHSFSVLIVEDDPDAWENLRDILELDGYEAELACSIRDVLEQDRLDRFAVILLDRKLPDGSGDDLLPYFREFAPEAAVILITGHADLQGAVTALRHGAADFLTKPMEPEILRLHLNRIREQRRLRQQLAETQQQLHQSERLAAIGQTITAISHEARNELTGLRLALSFLPEILDDRETTLEIIGSMRQSENRLQHLLDDVRGFAAPIHLESEVCEIPDLWRKAWGSLKPAWDHREISFEEDICDGNLALPVDAFRVEQVFRNLFENSLAACAADPVVIHVTSFSSFGPEPSLSVVVRDNGPGLNSAERQRIFQAFYTTKSHGTGLGLAIVQRIIEAHGGTIEASEEAIQGAEFVITFPIRDHALGTMKSVSTEAWSAPQISRL